MQFSSCEHLVELLVHPSARRPYDGLVSARIGEIPSKRSTGSSSGDHFFRQRTHLPSIASAIICHRSLSIWLLQNLLGRWRLVSLTRSVDFLIGVVTLIPKNFMPLSFKLDSWVCSAIQPNMPLLSQSIRTALQPWVNRALRL